MRVEKKLCARPLDSSDRCKELNIRGLAHKIHSIVCVHVWCVYVHVHTRVVAEGVLDTEFSLLLFFFFIPRRVGGIHFTGVALKTPGQLWGWLLNSERAGRGRKGVQ